MKVLGWVQHVRSRRAQDRSFCSGHGPDTVVAILISLQNQIPRTGRPRPKTSSPHNGVLTKDSQGLDFSGWAEIVEVL